MRRSKISVPLRPQPMTVWPSAINFLANAKPSPRVTPVIKIFMGATVTRQLAAGNAAQGPKLATLQTELIQTGLATRIHHEGQFFQLRRLIGFDEHWDVFVHVAHFFK